MTINYTTNLSLAEPVTGTESGTWGDDVNKGLTDYLDIAIAGTLALTSASFTAGALTLANTTGNSSSNGIVTTTAQYYIIKCSSLSTNVTITAPSSSKTYVVVNNDPTYTVTIKASGQTGVTIPVSSKALVVFNGTDYAQVGASAGGSTTQVQYNNGGALAGSSTFTFNSGTNTVTISTLNLTNALGPTYGGTNQTTYTTGDILYSSGTNTLSKLGIGSASQVLTVVGGVPAWSNASSGTVTTVSVVSANGFAGTVANASSTPAITLTTSVTGILQGNGTAISAVTIGSGLTFAGGTLSASGGSGTSIGLVRAISINCILP